MFQRHKRLLSFLLLLSLATTIAVRCYDDSKMIDRHKQKLDQEDE